MRPLRTRLSVSLIGGAAVLLLVAGFALRATIAAWVQSGLGRIAFTLRSDLMSDGSSSRRAPSFDLSAPMRGWSLAKSPHPATPPSALDLRLPDGRQEHPVQTDFVPPLSGRAEPAETRSAPVQEPSPSSPEAATFLGARERQRLAAGGPRLEPPVGFTAPRMLPAKVQLFIEYNPADGDAGIQASFDGQAWKRVKIVGPDGRTILNVTGKRGLKQVDLTELRFENEPFLADVLQRFAPGAYEFEGTTVEGLELGGTATLSHDIPDPALIFPVDPTNPVIAWTWSPGPGRPIQALASFQVTIENDLGVSRTFDLSPSTASLKVPPEFLAAGAEYKFEVLAIAANGNRTVTEGTFVAP